MRAIFGALGVALLVASATAEAKLIKFRFDAVVGEDLQGASDTPAVGTSLTGGFTYNTVGPDVAPPGGAFGEYIFQGRPYTYFLKVGNTRYSMTGVDMVVGNNFDASGGEIYSECASPEVGEEWDRLLINFGGNGRSARFSAYNCTGQALDSTAPPRTIEMGDGQGTTWSLGSNYFEQSFYWQRPNQETLGFDVLVRRLYRVPVPEPATLGLMVIGLAAGLGFARWRRSPAIGCREDGEHAP